MSVDAFLDFMQKLNGVELCAMAGVRGATITSVPGLVDKITAYEQKMGFEMVDQNHHLKPTYHRIAAGAVKYDENMDRAGFDRQAGLKAYTSFSVNAAELSQYRDR